MAGEARILPEGVATAVSLLAVWLLVIAVSTIDKTSFLSRETVLSVTFTMAVLGVLTVGQSLVTISGGVLDLSVPTALILPAWVIATLLTRGYQPLAGGRGRPGSPGPPGDSSTRPSSCSAS